MIISAIKKFGLLIILITISGCSQQQVAGSSQSIDGNNETVEVLLTWVIAVLGMISFSSILLWLKRKNIDFINEKTRTYIFVIFILASVVYIFYYIYKSPFDDIRVNTFLNKSNVDTTENLSEPKKSNINSQNQEIQAPYPAPAPERPRYFLNTLNDNTPAEEIEVCPQIAFEPIRYHTYLKDIQVTPRTGKYHVEPARFKENITKIKPKGKKQLLVKTKDAFHEYTYIENIYKDEKFTVEIKSGFRWLDMDCVNITNVTNIGPCIKYVPSKTVQMDRTVVDIPFLLNKVYIPATYKEVEFENNETVELVTHVLEKDATIQWQQIDPLYVQIDYISVEGGSAGYIESACKMDDELLNTIIENTNIISGDIHVTKNEIWNVLITEINKSQKDSWSYIGPLTIDALKRLNVVR